MGAELAGDQWNEGDVFCSVVRRVALPDAFFAIDGLFETFLTVLDEFGAFPAVIDAELRRYLPFLATTKMLMAAVREGVGRETAHEVIKSMPSPWRWRCAAARPTTTCSTGSPPTAGWASTRAALEALVAEPIEFTGAARGQVARVVTRIEVIAAQHPEAAAYTRGRSCDSTAATYSPGQILPPRLVDPAPAVHRVTAGDLGLPEGYRGLYSGKVRDLFSAPDGALLFVASDRISAYDWVLPTTIPDKGAILTQLSLWWFEQVAELVGSHVLSTEVPDAVRRPGDAVPTAEDVPRRVRGPWLPDRLRPGRVPRHRHRVRGTAARGPGRRLPAARADLHPGHQGRAR